MGTKHKHAEVIKAWADGAEIEFRVNPEHPWQKVGLPSWFDQYEYRIKPPKKTPGQVYYEAVESRFLWKTVYNKEHFDRGAQAVIEAYKRGEFDEVQDKGDNLR